MTTMTRSAYGLTTGPDDVNWRRLGHCAGKNPDWWVTDGVPTADNARARAMCGRCPVRERCRDTMLPTEPAGVIAGGWWWLDDGEADPYPGDTHLHPARARNAARAPERIRMWLDAAREHVAGASLVELCQRRGLCVTTVHAASQVLRRGDPDLIAAVEAGYLSLARATRDGLKAAA